LLVLLVFSEAMILVVPLFKCIVCVTFYKLIGSTTLFAFVRLLRLRYFVVFVSFVVKLLLLIFFASLFVLTLLIVVFFRFLAWFYLFMSVRIVKISALVLLSKFRVENVIIPFVDCQMSL
jgi:hypothetical protein